MPLRQHQQPPTVAEIKEADRLRGDEKAAEDHKGNQRVAPFQQLGEKSLLC